MESKSLNLHSQLNYACDLDSCNDVVLKVLKIESVKDNAEYSVTLAAEEKEKKKGT